MNSSSFRVTFKLNLLIKSQFDHSSQNQRTFVATADSIIACLNSDGGNLNWRVALPVGTLVHHIIAGKVPSGRTDIFSLTSIKQESDDINNDEHQFLLSAWSSEQGTLRWQLSLGSKKLSLTDLVYDSSRYLITSLSGNSIDTATVRGYLHSHWNPLLSTDAHIISNIKNGKQLVISQLILQVKSASNGPSNPIDPALPSRVAVGCFVDSSVSNIFSSNPSSLINFSPNESESIYPKCGETAILSVILPTKLVVHSDIPLSEKLPNIILKVYNSLPDISVNALRVVTSSEDASSSTAMDIIFGITSSSSNKQQPKVFALTLSNNKVTSMELPVDAHNIEINDNENRRSSSSYVASLLMTSSEKGVFYPAFVYCLNAESCRSYYMKITKNSKPDLKINLFGSCTGVDSILGIERYPEGSSIGMSLSCAVKKSSFDIEKNQNQNTCSNTESSCTGESSLQITSTSLRVDEEHSLSVFSLGMTVSVPSNTDSSVLLFLSSEILTDKENMNKSLRAIIVYSSLISLSYQSVLSPTLSSTVVSGKEIWMREEFLSKVKQAIIMEDSRNFDSTSVTHTVEGEDAAPGLSKRLLMQFDEIKVDY